MEENKLQTTFNIDTLDTERESDTASVKDGESYFRILPPFGTNNRGALFAYQPVHWVEIDGENDSFKFPVGCPYPVEKFCPDCEKAWAIADEMKALDKDSKAFEEADALRFKYAADNAYYLNALNQDGQVKKLKLKPTYITGRRGQEGKKEGVLIKKIKEAVGMGVDPTSLTQGLWFKFSRSGKGFGTEYTVDFKQKSALVNGKIVQETTVSSIADDFPETYQAIVQQLQSGGEGPLFDIHALYDRVTSAELNQIRETRQLPERLRRNRRRSAESVETEASSVQTEQPAQQAPAAATAAPAAETKAPVASIKAETKVEAKPAGTTSSAIQAELARIRSQGLRK
jgi:hypothetical protein